MAEVPVNHTHEGKTIALCVGDVLVVTLPVNMLTGLRWRIATYDQSSLALLEETVVPPPSGGGTGAGGTVAVFRFRSEAPALSQLVLELRVGNEPDKDVQKYRLLLDVRA